MAARIRILTVIGARPQIIKAAAISRAIAASFRDRIEEVLVHTGQHYDGNMSQVFFDELGIPRPHVDLGVGSAGHAVQTARMMEGIESQINAHKPDLVLLYGDTNSTIAGSVAAARTNVPVAHVEAGLRSFNIRMPEEVNRIVCDHGSTWLFCPTSTAVNNLEREGLNVNNTAPPSVQHPFVDMCGDVMYDNSLHFVALATQRSTVLHDLDLQQAGYALVTVHRDANTDDPTRLEQIFSALIKLHDLYELALVLPLHPRTRKVMENGSSRKLFDAVRARKAIHLIAPVGFLDMIALERSARLVITDSGGVQKEAYFFGRPCIILRNETEWVELVEAGQAALCDADPDRILAACDRYLTGALPDCPAIFGDGDAAEKICARLVADLG